MKMFNRCAAIMLSIVPIALSAVENFDLINANYALSNAPIIYYRIYGPTRLVPKTGPAVKQLRGIFNVRVDVKTDEALFLELSANSDMSNAKSFWFSPQYLQKAVKTLEERAAALKKQPNKTEAEKKQLEAMQRGAVKATTCYITARVKSPTDKQILLSPQNPTTQYSKQTAQGLSLQANVSPALLSILEEFTMPWDKQIVYALAPKGATWRSDADLATYPLGVLTSYAIPLYVFADALAFARIAGQVVYDITTALGTNPTPGRIAELTQQTINIFKSKSYDELVNSLKILQPTFNPDNKPKPLLELVVREFFGKADLTDFEKDELENITKRYAAQIAAGTPSIVAVSTILNQYIIATQKFDKAIPAWKRLANVYILGFIMLNSNVNIRDDILGAGEKYKFMFRN